MGRSRNIKVPHPRAIGTKITTQDKLHASDLDPQSPKLIAIAGPPAVEPRTVDMDDLPQRFHWIEADEWEQIHNQT